MSVLDLLREPLGAAVCPCGHPANWHGGITGCWAEDYTLEGEACECRNDWLAAVMPTMETVLAPHLADPSAAADRADWIADKGGDE